MILSTHLRDFSAGVNHATSDVYSGSTPNPSLSNGFIRSVKFFAVSTYRILTHSFAAGKLVEESVSPAIFDKI